ncbi:CPBP family intramembrane metalloprotease [Candidatus Saccharibacteria bacterium]|nr:MAG: CPBP family intramembrane metalloprotease [Candidatus Saccharibacteria bacterium]
MSGWGRLVAGVSMYALLAGLIIVSGLGLKDLGLTRSRVRAGAMLGLRVSMVIAAGLLLGFLVVPEIFRDERYHQGIWLALVFALFVVPLQTVAFEELLFRGLLWGYVRRLKGPAMATQVSSVAFGLWHIAPSLAINAAAISVGGVGIHRGLLITGIVFVTYGAGVALCELRRRSDSLLAPILVHWAINGFSVILAALAWNAR